MLRIYRGLSKHHISTLVWIDAHGDTVADNETVNVLQSAGLIVVIPATQLVAITPDGRAWLDEYYRQNPHHKCS